MGVDGAGCGGLGSLGSQGKRGEDGSSHEGPQAGIRAGTLEPWVHILACSSSPQFPAYTLEVVTLPTQRAVGFLAVPLLQIPEAAHKAESSGVSLAGSKHMVPHPPPGLPVIPSFCLGCAPHHLSQTYRTVTSSSLLQASFRPWPVHGLCSPPLEPTALRLAQDSLGDSSQLCLHLALRFILLALSSHLPPGPPVGLGEMRSIPTPDPECLLPGTSFLLGFWALLSEQPAVSGASGTRPLHILLLPSALPPRFL